MTPEQLARSNKSIEYYKLITGQKTVKYPEFSSFAVTGIDRNGRRFKMESENYFYLRSVNVWQGTLWGVRKDGSRKALRKYYN